VWPSQDTGTQPLKLPKQTRVGPEEYQEFLRLGHGEVFLLDLERCGAARAARQGRLHSGGPCPVQGSAWPKPTPSSAPQLRGYIEQPAAAAASPPPASPAAPRRPAPPARVTEAPWRAPNADISDYFNYGFTERTWRDYQRRVMRFRAEFMYRWPGAAAACGRLPAERTPSRPRRSRGPRAASLTPAWPCMPQR
jgi:hypothetical protein